MSPSLIACLFFPVALDNAIVRMRGEGGYLWTVAVFVQLNVLLRCQDVLYGYFDQVLADLSVLDPGLNPIYRGRVVCTVAGALPPTMPMTTTSRA